jgi:hypothetical protein
VQTTGNLQARLLRPQIGTARRLDAFCLFGPQFVASHFANTTDAAPPEEHFSASAVRPHPALIAPQFHLAQHIVNTCHPSAPVKVFGANVA